MDNCENTCGTCHHKGEKLSEHSVFFTCGYIKHCHEYGDNEDVGEAYVVDGSGYFAALRVSEDFGCNQWEPENPEKKIACLKEQIENLREENSRLMKTVTDWKKDLSIRDQNIQALASQIGEKNDHINKLEAALAEWESMAVLAEWESIE